MTYYRNISIQERYDADMHKVERCINSGNKEHFDTNNKVVEAFTTKWCFLLPYDSLNVKLYSNYLFKLNQENMKS